MSQRELDLEHALADLGAALDFPPTPDLAAAVSTRLREAPAAPATTRPWGRLTGLVHLPAWRRVAAVGLAAVLLAAAVLVASPGTREAVARRLGLRGVEIRLEPPPPTATTSRPGTSLGLGERVTLEEARRRVAFPVLVPAGGGLDRPSEVFVNDVVPDGGRVDLVYQARPGLPASQFTDVGLLISQFQGRPTVDFIKKVSGLGLVEQVTVNGEPGYWFSGEPHFFTYVDANGEIREERTRLAGNTLIWERGELTLRLEGELSRQEAIRIAGSMR
jgi:hypothetical protein